MKTPQIPAMPGMGPLGKCRPEYALKHVAQAYMRAFDSAAETGTLQPCEYGHLTCSARRNGPCLDEILANFPELNEGSD